VEDELADAVRKSWDVFRGKFDREVFDARDWIDVRAFSVEEFDEDLGHWVRRAFLWSLRRSVSFAPLELDAFPLFSPRLAPWAAFFRRFAARFSHGI
jgi:hypothetical protein